MLFKTPCIIQLHTSVINGYPIVTRRPHERGVQPVRRTGAHEYHRGPWISKFKIEMGNYSSKTLIQGLISDWSFVNGPSLDWCIWVCMGPMADWSLSLHVDGPLFRFVRAVVCRGLEIVLTDQWAWLSPFRLNA